MTGVGLLGCGAMGRQIANAICSARVGDARLVALYDEERAVASSLLEDLPLSLPLALTFDSFIGTSGLDLVVECAAPAAVRAYAERVISSGKDLLLMSSGALTDSSLHDLLASLARDKGRRLMVPSGALGGIDAIRAVRDQLEEVTLTTTKPPGGLSGAPGFKDWESVEITEPQVIFEGPALEAVRLFPANVNVAATLGLAGIGPRKTMVRVVADPNSSINVHEVVAKGAFGVLRFRMELRPHEQNPRTSALAVHSAVETLRVACSLDPKIGT